MKKKIISTLLLSVISLSGCSMMSGTIDLMKDASSYDIPAIDINNASYEETNPREEIIDFSLNLMRDIYNGGNMMISPVSLVSALTIAANGAKGETLDQIINDGQDSTALIKTDIDTLNGYLKVYREDYLISDSKNKVNAANSIWIKDAEYLQVNDEFLSINKTYFDTDVFKAPFDDMTIDDINSWVKKETDDMIDKILNYGAADNAVMFLINAVSFDAKWQEEYYDTQVTEDYFYTEEGISQKAEMMNSTEYTYLETDQAVGVLKLYKNAHYAFVALLPDEGVTLDSFLDTLTGEKLITMLEGAKTETVYTKIPKFTADYSIDLSDSLKRLGMTDAFDSSLADFSGMVESDNGNIFIDYVIHKTKIEVDEKGTKAAAATAISIGDGSSAEPADPLTVYLDRPFVYMIIDMEQKLPLFIGCLNSIE